MCADLSVSRGTDLTGVYIGDKQTMHPNDSSRVILDTATTLIYISSASAALFYKSIPAARYLSSTDTWTVPCDISKKTLPALPPISFAVQGQRWRMPLEDLAFQGISSNGRCVAAVQGGATSFAVLGDAFIKSELVPYCSEVKADLTFRPLPRTGLWELSTDSSTNWYC